MSDETAKSILDDIKKHPVVAIIFWFVGIATFFVLFYFFGHDFYILKTDVEKTHVTNEKFNLIKQEVETLKADNLSLRKYSAEVDSYKLSMSNSVCQQFNADIKTLSDRQYVSHDDIERQLLNQQIIQLREKLAQCGK
jgi:hypothetical protein